jgi:hypothetical protein
VTTKVRVRAAGSEQSLPVSEYELETALVKERVAGPDSLTPEERAILRAFYGRPSLHSDSAVG